MGGTKPALFWFGFMLFNVTFNNISFISWRLVLLVEETGDPGENHWPVASHWQTLLLEIIVFYLFYNNDMRKILFLDNIHIILLPVKALLYNRVHHTDYVTFSFIFYALYFVCMSYSDTFISGNHCLNLLDSLWEISLCINYV